MPDPKTRSPLVKHGVMRALPPEDYDDPDRRRWTEDEARRTFAQYVQEHDLALLDAPVGRWEKVTQEFEEGDPWTRWEYRLVGYSPSESPPSTP